LWDDFIQEELRDEEANGGRHKVDDENIALAIPTKKGKFKKFVIGESTSQDNKKIDMNKVKCFTCHKFGHHAGQCRNKKKGGNEVQPEVATSAKAQVDEFSKKFETELLLVSHLSSSTILVDAWLLDNGATCHMTRARFVRKLQRVRLRCVRGTWCGDQVCSEGIWVSANPNGVRRCFESDECVMGAKTHEGALSLND